MEGFSNKELKVLDSLHKSGKIPDTTYTITEEILSDYVQTYGELFTAGNGRMRSSDKRLARKLAGRTLIKHNVYLGAKLTEIPAGVVYLIENPAFPDHCKIGMTTDLAKRLSQFQTYDPYRAYSVTHYEFTLDRRQAEKLLLEKFSVSDESGEWVPIHFKDEFIREISKIPV